ncbi:imelysin family protein [Spirosoma endbachense]|uniref:Peptidase M75, Imelysin n=1 Tax=Spirosoma endbachense TaxID=2666025 RepID=A0A6P1VXQ3_9BACT|nr:imelysin family protein [Spirosoma endbachense]QHV96862.1 peptidase M75, Imelysin [Spirosoma endbachense]
MRTFILATLVIAGTFVGIQSCTKSTDDQPSANSSFDRKAMLTNLSSNIIIPAYTAFQTTTVTLDGAVTAFNAGPDLAKLTALQAAFQAAYKQWQATSAFGFGPADQANLRVNINTYPADITQINSNISAGTYDSNLLSNLAAKGLPALDYLLFGIGADNNAILQQYTSDSKAGNRKTYLATLSAEMKNQATTVLNAWNSGYTTTFLNATGTDVGSSTGQLINQLVYDYEILKNYEIGIPAGVQSMGTPFPQKVQAYYAKLSVQLALLHIQTLQSIYLGKSAQGDGPGLDDYLTQANAKASNGSSLNDVIKNQFATAIAKLQGLSDPLSDTIKTNQASVTATYTELQKLTVLLKTDMTSSLGILITYGDNDGD